MSAALYLKTYICNGTSSDLVNRVHVAEEHENKGRSKNSTHLIENPEKAGVAPNSVWIRVDGEKLSLTPGLDISFFGST